MYRTKLTWTAAAAAVLVVAGCSSTGGSASPTHQSQMKTSMSMHTPMKHNQGHKSGHATGGMASLTISNFAYSVSGKVTPGETVDVTNQDPVAHTVTSDQSGLFNVTVQANGGTATFKAPTKPGSYPYHCNFHSNMHGTLVVK